MTTNARRTAFEGLADQIYDPLQRYIRRRCPQSDVDEVLNDSLVTIWRRLDDVPEGAELAWSLGVARRTLANHHRGAARRLRLVTKVGLTARPATTDWTHPLDAELAEALTKLSDVDREVVQLWAWEQLEPREIAVVLDTTPNAISVRLRRIRQRLESELVRQNAGASGHSSREDDLELDR